MRHNGAGDPRPEWTRDVAHEDHFPENQELQESSRCPDAAEP